MREYSELALATSFRSRVRTTESDSAHRIYPHELLSFMQEAADIQGIQTQTSSKDFAERNLAYMLSKIRVDLNSVPLRTGDELCIVTWTQAVKGVRIIRDFDFFLSEPLEENYLGSGQMELFVVDLESRKPQRLADVFGEDYKKTFSNSTKAYTDLAEKLPPLFSSWQEAKDSGLCKISRKVSYSQVDANLHMNNIHYLAGATDAVASMEVESADHLLLFDWLKMQVNYESETLFGESVHFFVKEMSHAENDFEKIQSEDDIIVEKEVVLEGWIEERACPAFRSKLLYSINRLSR